mgnify:CR=1 FL=1
MPHLKHFILTLILAPVLAACGSTEAPDANPMPHDTLKGPGMFSGESGNILDAFRPDNDDGSAASIGVNGYLWRAALDTISFMPLKEVDSAGGVITTDWLTNTKTNTERYRMNVLIKGRKLAAGAVSVNIFTQKREGIEWVDVATPAATQAQIEDTILTRARSLRVADRLE